MRYKIVFNVIALIVLVFLGRWGFSEESEIKEDDLIVAMVQVDKAESTTGWSITGAGSNLTTSSNHKEGNHSMSGDKTDTSMDYIRFSKNIPITDYSNYKGVEIWVYIPNTNINRIGVWFGNTAQWSNGYWCQWLRGSNWIETGWKHLSKDKSSFGTYGAPDWSTITNLIVEVTADNATDTFSGFLWDDWHLYSSNSGVGVQGKGDPKDLIKKITQLINGTAGNLYLTRDGRHTAQIVIGPEATWIEKHAADELQDYLWRMSGARLQVVTVGEQEQVPVIILVGRAETNPLIARLCESGKLSLSTKTPGLDGFVIKSVPAEKTTWLVMGGSVDRGTLYAVYHLLEAYLHIGFFEDGEYIPRQPTIRLPHLDLSERPAFRERQFMQSCARGYTTAFWQWDEWKYELNWATKKKVNLYWITHGASAVSARADYALGWGTGTLDAAGVFERDLAKRIFKYLRQLGARNIAHPGFDPMVPESFRDAFPEAHYSQWQWASGGSPGLVLYPSDPLYIKMVASRVQAYIDLYGTDHLYFSDPISEATKIGDTPEERTNFPIDYARAVIAGIKKADPDGIWVCGGWGFIYPAWPPEAVKRLTDNVPQESFWTWDQWCELEPAHIKQNYFYGKDWLFCYLYAMGANSNLHGDMAGSIHKAQGIFNNPKADHCIGMGFMPEIMLHNPIYFDLVMQLEWNPMKVELDTFLADYALRRYGTTAAPAMVQSLWILANSIYGLENWNYTTPLYQDRLGPGSRMKPERHTFLQPLRDAVALALSAPKEAEDNPLYVFDCVDIARQYLQELTDHHIERALIAYERKDKTEFQNAVAVVSRCFDNLQLILSSHPRFWIWTEIEQARSHPVPPVDSYYMGDQIDYRKNLDAYIRMRRSEQGGLSNYPHPSLDYQRKDLFELVKYYYRRRVEVLFDAMGRQLASGKPDDVMAEANARYKQITFDFVLKSLPSPSEFRYPGPTLDAVRHAFQSAEKEK